MQKHAKRIIAAVSLSGILFLSACSGETSNETKTSVPETTQAIEQTTVIAEQPTDVTEQITVPLTKKEENLSRVVEVPYENEHKAIFTFNEKGLLVSSENCPWGADNDYYKYDEQNRITEIQHTLWDGTIDDGCERFVYSYDEKGNVKKISVYTGAKESLRRYMTYEFEYNSQGLLTKETTRSGDLKNTVTGTSINEYNENGQLIKNVTESHGTKNETAYIYNENGNVAEKTELSGDSENSYLYHYVYNYENDGNGKITKKSVNLTNTKYDDDGNIVDSYSYDETTEYVYENENIVKETVTSSEGNNEITEYVYKNGNMVKEISSSGIVEYEYHDNNRIVTVYWGGKDKPGEININVVPEVMGNYEKLMYRP